MHTENTTINYIEEGTEEQVHKYFLAAIVESSQDSIVTIDLNRIVTTWNKAAEDLYGYKAEEVIGKPLLIEKLRAYADESSFSMLTKLDVQVDRIYFRVNGPLTTKTPGIGLGLYITAQIVHQHGGKIFVESKEGVGSTFSFTIPQQ